MSSVCHAVKLWKVTSVLTCLDLLCGYLISPPKKDIVVIEGME